jgi:hypothetical protein
MEAIDRCIYYCFNCLARKRVGEGVLLEGEREIEGCRPRIKSQLPGFLLPRKINEVREQANGVIIRNNKIGGETGRNCKGQKSCDYS